MYEIIYYCVGLVVEVVDMLLKVEDGKIFGGGQILLFIMKQCLVVFFDLVDVIRIVEMKGICDDGDGVVIGVVIIYVEVVGSDIVKGKLLGLVLFVSGIGDLVVCYMGMIGGLIVNNDLVVDYLFVLVVLGVMVVMFKWELVVEEFFIGMFEIVFDDDEVVVFVKFLGVVKSVYFKYLNLVLWYVMVGVFVVQGVDGLVKVVVIGVG